MRRYLTFLGLIVMVAIGHADTRDHAKSQVTTHRAVTPETPPAILFHVGERATLMKDVIGTASEPGEVPQPDWDKYIMGQATRFQLPTYRRGFYGTGKPLEAYYFGSELLDEGKEPWIIAIRVRSTPECTDPSKLFPRTETDEFQDSRFKKWLTGPEFPAWVKKTTNPPFSKYSQVEAACVEVRKPPGAGEIFNAYPYYLMGNEKQRDTPCQKLLEGYFEEKQIAIVTDAAFDDSWFIRRRECIQKITGSPEDLLSYLRNGDSDFWHWKDLGEYAPETVGPLFRQVLGHLSSISQTALSDLNKNIAQSYPKSSEPFVVARVAPQWDEMRLSVKKLASCLGRVPLKSLQAKLLDEDNVATWLQSNSCK